MAVSVPDMKEKIEAENFKKKLIEEMEKISKNGNSVFSLGDFLDHNFRHFLSWTADRSPDKYQMPANIFAILLQHLKENESIDRIRITNFTFQSEFVADLAEILKVKKLKTLDMGGYFLTNSFLPKDLKIILNALIANKTLSSLTTAPSPSLFNLIANTTSLTTLDFGLHPSFIGDLGLALQRNNTLLSLELSIRDPENDWIEDHVDGIEGWPNFIVALREHPCLQNLGLGVSNLAQQKVEELALVIENNVRLTTFNFVEGGMGCSITPFAKALLKNRTLKSFTFELNIDVEETAFTDFEGMKVLAEALKTNTSLTSLKFEPHVDPDEEPDKELKGFQEICWALQDNESLTQLSLSIWNSTPDNISSLLEILKANYRLTELDMFVHGYDDDDNKISEKDVITNMQNYCERNKRIQRNWAQAAFAIAWLRANINHTFRHSFPPLLNTHILTLANIQRKDTDISLFGIQQNSQHDILKIQSNNSTQKPAFLDSRFAKSIIFSNFAMSSKAQSGSVSSLTAAQGNAMQNVNSAAFANNTASTAAAASSSYSSSNIHASNMNIEIEEETDNDTVASNFSSKKRKNYNS